MVSVALPSPSKEKTRRRRSVRTSLPVQVTPNSPAARNGVGASPALTSKAGRRSARVSFTPPDSKVAARSARAMPAANNRDRTDPTDRTDLMIARRRCGVVPYFPIVRTVPCRSPLSTSPSVSSRSQETLSDIEGLWPSRSSSTVLPSFRRRAAAMLMLSRLR